MRNELKTIWTYVKLVICSIIVFYPMAALMAWDFNPANWHSVLRVLTVIIVFGMAIVCMPSNSTKQ